MKSALLHYEYGDVFRNLRRICRKNGFRIQSFNEESGEVNAVKGWTFLGNKSHLHIQVEKTSKLVTKVNVELMLKGLKKPDPKSEHVEGQIVDTIYKFF